LPHISEAAPLQIQRFYTGLYTYRNPLVIPIRQFGRRIIELYDAIADGLNMENSNRLTLDRRPGYTVVNPNPVNGVPLWFYAFKPANFPGQIYNLVDTTLDIEWIQPGDEPNAVIANKTSPGMSSFAQVGAYLYIANPNIMTSPNGASSLLKWDSPAGAQGVTQWGLDINAANGSTGPNTYSWIENLPSTNPLLQANPAWGTAGPGSVTLPPANSAGVPSVSQIMLTEQYNFVGNNTWSGQTATNAVPPPYVTGVVVTLTGLETAGTGISLNVWLAENGATIGIPHMVMLPANAGTINIGGASDLWGTNIQPADVLNGTFGVAIQAVNASNAPATYTISTGGISMSVFIVNPPEVIIPEGTGAAPPPTGTLTAQVGYQYVFCYGNSYSGHISSPSFPSIYGVPTDASYPLVVPYNTGVDVYVTPSPDPQVTSIHIFRTTDGGGQPFFELPNSPIPNETNTTFLGSPATVIVDYAQDWQLQIANIAPLPHFNDPPPQGAVDPVWFGGRLWMHNQNKLYFASGPDITMGNGNEAWFPAYIFSIPNAQIIRKFSTPNGMLVFTTDTVLIVRGISTASFTVNDFMLDTGIKTWTAADTDGTNIYIYTSDKQLLLINANGMSSMSQNIADVIMAVDPTLAYLTIYRYQATENWVMLSDGSTTIYPFNVELQCWSPIAQPIGGVMALATVETSPGLWQLWRGTPVANSIISFRDTTVYTDLGTPYPCRVIFGPITIADFLTLAQVRDIAISLAPTQTRVFVSVIANEISSAGNVPFQIMEYTSTEPPELSGGAYYAHSFRNYRYTWKSTPLPEIMNFLFLRLDFDPVANPDELWGFTVGGTQTTGGSALGQAGQLPQLQGR
jgi:hypothetical protein